MGQTSHDGHQFLLAIISEICVLLQTCSELVEVLDICSLTRFILIGKQLSHVHDV